MRLYEIGNALRDVIGRGLYVDDESGEVFDSSDLDALNEALDDKLEACAIVIKELESDADAIDAEARSLMERSAGIRRKVDRLTSYVERVMSETGRDEVTTSRASIKWGRRSDRVIVDDASRLPQEYMRPAPVRYVPDKAAIRDAIKSGAYIYGAHIEQSRKLQVV